MPPRSRARQQPVREPSPAASENESIEETISQEEVDEDDDDDLDDEEPTVESAMPESSTEGLKEIGNLASWTVSTAKPGNGVEQLRDEDTNLFWQSDGPQPHTINIHFAKRVFVKKISMYLDFENDESYTPTRMSVFSGTGYHDLQEVTTMNFEQPSGWIDVNLEGVHEDGQLRTFLIQVCIHANHQNGKDTHVRGLQIFSAEPPSFDSDEVPFTSRQMLTELELR
ncbi:anaphase-promoting complex, subunit 10-domain-containing protein [Tuber borchii]|uniref:Anaphase-promoting complex subunit 10 n=1 Tax=Tuber borchii TaxID=42251 RepID=A0A2T6ZUK8_TUBBO|nr:anaphase-promoting complex, subunit 10-domain-containing protein [Tuber borchii]